jgi:hypothetical protein
MECIVSFSVSLKEVGATVQYLNKYISPGDIEEHLESETSLR